MLTGGGSIGLNHAVVDGPASPLGPQIAGGPAMVCERRCSNCLHIGSRCVRHKNGLRSNESAIYDVPQPCQHLLVGAASVALDCVRPGLWQHWQEVQGHGKRAGGAREGDHT